MAEGWTQSWSRGAGQCHEQQGLLTRPHTPSALPPPPSTPLTTQLEPPASGTHRRHLGTTQGLKGREGQEISDLRGTKAKKEGRFNDPKEHMGPQLKAVR